MTVGVESGVVVDGIDDAGADAVGTCEGVNVAGGANVPAGEGLPVAVVGGGVDGGAVGMPLG